MDLYHSQDMSLYIVGDIHKGICTSIKTDDISMNMKFFWLVSQLARSLKDIWKNYFTTHDFLLSNAILNDYQSVYLTNKSIGITLTNVSNYIMRTCESKVKSIIIQLLLIVWITLIFKLFGSIRHLFCSTATLKVMLFSLNIHVIHLLILGFKNYSSDVGRHIYHNKLNLCIIEISEWMSCNSMVSTS